MLERSNTALDLVLERSNTSLDLVLERALRESTVGTYPALVLLRGSAAAPRLLLRAVRESKFSSRASRARPTPPSRALRIFPFP